MNIAVNTRLLLKNKLEGIGWFTHETLSRITRQHPEHHFTFLFDRKYSEEFIFSNNITPVVTGPQARHPFLWYLWFEWSVTRALKKHKTDLFLSLDGWLSLKTNVRSLSVIHDLNFVHRPKDILLLPRRYYHYFFPKFAQKAIRIATVSEFSKKDIIQQYNISTDKIDVVYNGANEIYKPVSETEQQKTRDKYCEGNPFFLFIGLIHPRKNIANLLIAFEKFKSSYSNNIKLMIVGEKKWWTKDVKNAYKNMYYKNDVIMTGRLDSNEIKYLLPSAIALTYISYFEGFGIPILEAMYCETPVITSDVT